MTAARPPAGADLSVAGPSAGLRDALRVGLLAFLWLAATSGLRPLMAPDEGRYVASAWEMLRSGDWLTPTLDGLPFFHKPPLFYWLTAAALRVAGLHEAAGRFAPLAGAWLGAMALYLFTRRWRGTAAARSALVVLLAQPFFFVGAQFANLDMLVAGCITATVLMLAHAVLLYEHGLPHRRAVLAGHALAALGVLAKGLIGVVIPALVLGLWLLLRGRWRSVLALLWPPALALLAVLALPWFVLVEQRHPGFLHYFFVVQHFQRYAATGFNNVQPLWFYPAVLAGFSLPMLPWLLRWRRLPPAGAPALRGLMAATVAGVLLFFSLPQSKLVGYILPAVPALAWLFAEARPGAGAPAWQRRAWAASLALGVLASLGLVIGLAFFDSRHTTRDLGLGLRGRVADAEPVVMLDDYFYDVPFYARLRAPVWVVEDWDDPATTQRDNWRQELFEAGRFDPPRADALLPTPKTLPARLCTLPSAWVLASPKDAARTPWLAAQAPAFRAHGKAAWHLDLQAPATRAALGCGGTPNGG